MTNYFKISFGITLFSALLSLFLPIFIQNILAGLGILTVGILHGANDLKILTTLKSSTKFKTRDYFIIYIGVVLLGITIFYFFPSLGLLTFIVVSCYHFGEQHWEGKLNPSLPPFFFYSLYGALLFFLLFTFQYEDTIAVISQIIPVTLSFSFFWMTLGILCLLFFLTLFRYVQSFSQIFIELGLLVILSILFAKASLLFGFAFYFVVWHSIPSLQEQISYLYPSSSSFPLYQYFKSAVLYWIMALLGLLFAYYYIGVTEKNFLAVFFSFLAAITFPHVVVIGSMFRHKKDHEG